MFCKCIAVGSRRLSENNQNCLLQSVFFPFYISFATTPLWTLICIASTSLQQNAVAGRVWEWGDRQWLNLLPIDVSPGSFLGREEEVESLPQGSPTACQEVPRTHLKVLSSSCVFSQHEGNTLSLLQGTFLAEAGNKCVCWTAATLSHFILHSTVFMSVVYQHRPWGLGGL